MPAIRVFEPALCCNTGVCGPELDQSLVDFTADLTHLQTQGVDIARHNLANDPMAFASDESARAFLQVAGSDGLPLTLVDGVTVMTGTYPSRAQLLRFAGIADEQPVTPAGAVGLVMLDASTDAAGECGCGPEGCS
ncbi:MAG: arsenite efflux transporter metallochaperone ArsD [Frankiales bacterium]|nr:arsenite efflux transporter metallochaperone ArsD [Frankiales bacterium]